MGHREVIRIGALDEKMGRNAMSGKTVVLANGEFPRKGGAAWRLLAAAAHVVCCDGAADAYRRRFGKVPDAVVGDMDSAGASARACGADIVRFTDQDTNDLEKAIVFCAMRGWKDPVVVGATGKREDHTLGNVFRALAYGVEIVTDCGRFVPLCGTKTFRLAKGTAVSVFAPDPKTRMTSKGLAWPLGGVRFRNLFCATLNRTTAEKVVLASTRPVSVYIAT